LVALCYDERTWHRLSLYWGVVPLMIPFAEDTQDLLETGVEEAIRHQALREGDTVVVVFGFSATGANAIKVHQL